MQESGRYMIVEKYRDNSRLARSVWWDKEVNSERGTVHLRELFGNKVFNFPNPETLLNRIIQISTVEGDIVLDYHLGSGTTATTAHKMQRQYIGIEQMDYIETVAVERLKKVIGKKVSLQKEETIQQELKLVLNPVENITNLIMIKAVSQNPSIGKVVAHLFISSSKNTTKLLLSRLKKPKIAKHYYKFGSR